jgi:hypothetical protein
MEIERRTVEDRWDKKKGAIGGKGGERKGNRRAPMKGRARKIFKR